MRLLIYALVIGPWWLRIWFWILDLLGRPHIL